jgi:hypothetical protein
MPGLGSERTILSVSRKGAKRHKSPAKTDASQSLGAVTVSVLPMDIQIGDLFTNEEDEWEVVSHPATLHGAKSLRARVQQAVESATERDVTWPAHVRVEIRRGLSQG